MRKSITLVATVILSALTVFACSSSNGPNDPKKTDGGTTDPNNPNPNNPDPSNPNNPDPTNPDNNDQDAGTAGPNNQATCIAACEAKYPTATADNKSLDDQCFYGGTCEPVCNNLGNGPGQPPNAAGQAACNTAAAGSWDISTGSQACSSCLATTPVCCNLWIKIFGSQEGKDLNACAHECWSKFPN